MLQNLEREMARSHKGHPLFLEEEKNLMDCSLLAQKIFDLLRSVSHNRLRLYGEFDQITVDNIWWLFPEEDFDEVYEAIEELSFAGLIFFGCGIIDVPDGISYLNKPSWRGEVDKRIKNNNFLPSDIVCKQSAATALKILSDTGILYQIKESRFFIHRNNPNDESSVMSKFIEYGNKNNLDKILFEELLDGVNCRPLFFSQIYMQILDVFKDNNNIILPNSIKDSSIDRSIEKFNNFGKRWIYVARADSFNPIIKIGITKNLSQRIASLNSNCPYPIELFYSTKGNEDLEEEIFSYLECVNMSGEWFNIYPSQAVELIEDIKFSKI